MRCLSTGFASAITSSIDGAQPAFNQRARPHRHHQRLARPGARTPSYKIVDTRGGTFGLRTGCAYEFQNRVRNAVARGDLAHEALCGHDFLCIQHLLDAAVFEPSR